VDLNFATPEQLSAVCGLPPEMAQEVVAARVQLGRFDIVEDAIRFGQVSEDHAPLVRDRGIVVDDRWT
jgi:DNA uptake protein ComE-like DNA-binding protein